MLVSQVNTHTAFLGHLGTSELAGVDEFIFFAVLALNTLCSMAVGVVDKSLVGLWLQTALVFVVIGVAMVALWYVFAVGAILNLSFSEDDPVVFGSLFARIMALALLPQLLFCALSAYLASFDVKETQVPSAQTFLASVVQTLCTPSQVTPPLQPNS
ncbi:hypothetical protein AC1031_011989 [Aphanomyces cochlioides]|nr:hypothetical protein AC1031_011989 [Aphanomyces cochlioides]